MKSFLLCFVETIANMHIVCRQTQTSDNHQKTKISWKYNFLFHLLRNANANDDNDGNSILGSRISCRNGRKNYMCDSVSGQLLFFQRKFLLSSIWKTRVVYQGVIQFYLSFRWINMHLYSLEIYFLYFKSTIKIILWWHSKTLIDVLNKNIVCKIFNYIFSVCVLFLNTMIKTKTPLSFDPLKIYIFIAICQIDMLL